MVKFIYIAICIGMAIALDEAHCTAASVLSGLSAIIIIVEEVGSYILTRQAHGDIPEGYAVDFNLSHVMGLWPVLALVSSTTAALCLAGIQLQNTPFSTTMIVALIMVGWHLSELVGILDAVVAMYRDDDDEAGAEEKSIL